MAQIPIVQHFCTCTDEDYNPTLLGWRQKEYEKYILGGMTIFDTLNKMGVKRLCCREKLFNPPMFFLNNADIGRLRDDTGLLTKGSKVPTIRSGQEIVPKKPFPEIPK